MRPTPAAACLLRLPAATGRAAPTATRPCLAAPPHRLSWVAARPALLPSACTPPRTFATSQARFDAGRRSAALGGGKEASKSDSAASSTSRPRRSMLYVPGSSEKMIKKSQTSASDCIIFDLEDSVAAHRKVLARETVFHALEAAARPGPELAVRINPPSGDATLAADDLDVILPARQLQTLVVPKVEHEDDIRFILSKAKALRPSEDYATLSLILSVESAASLLRMPTIIEAIRQELAGQQQPVAEIGALLFASEDYCASTGIIRTRSRRELLFPRAHMATIAKAHGLAAIDMVCIDYKDMAYLEDECNDGAELGFDGKQAIHPAQVETIQARFAPSEEAIKRAAKIKHLYERSVAEHRGAYGLKEGDSLIMIDAPMLLQADAVLLKARAAGLPIPEVSQEEEQ